MNIITPELLTDLLKGSLLPVAGAVGQSAVMVGGEWIKLWQMKNAVSIGQTAVKILRKRGITSKEQLRDITTKFGILYLEGASVEDEPELQELWAKLLANALDSNFEDDIRIAFMSIIKDLTALDAKILNIINNELLKLNKGTNIFKLNFSIKYISRILSISEFIVRVSIDNLKRCQLVENAQLNAVNLSPPVEVVTARRTQTQRMNNQLVTPSNPDHFVISALGYLFIDACIA